MSKLYLASSLAGHDKCRVYLVIDEDHSVCYVCDGKSKTVHKPKKKKKKHVQKIIHLKEEIQKQIEILQKHLDEEAADEMIKNILDLYEAGRRQGIPQETENIGRQAACSMHRRNKRV